MTTLQFITAAAIAGSLSFSAPLSGATDSRTSLPVPVPFSLPTSPTAPASAPTPLSNNLACGSSESGRVGPCGRAGCSGRDQYCTSYVVFNFLGFTLYRHCTGTLNGVDSAVMRWG